MNRLLVAVAVALSSLSFESAAVPAFPGAEGGGAASVGGRGGRAIEVINTENAGPGSLRACIDAAGPRTCIFLTGGSIVLQSPLLIRNPFLTIAGQTAPGGGIQIRGDAILIQPPAHDIIIRHIRLRRGYETPGGDFDKGLGISSGSVAGSASTATISNIIIDHCSLGWQQDDNDVWGKEQNITLQWNIYAEANNKGPFDGINGKGLLVGTPPGQAQDTGRIAIHHNFFTSNYSRNPALVGLGPTELVNNVVYNWGGGTLIQNRGPGTRLNIIGNHYKEGPDTQTVDYEILVVANGGHSGVVEQLPETMYVQDNFGPHRTSSAQPEFAIVGYCGNCSVPAPTSFQRSTPWPATAFPITVTPAQENVDNVLNNVGATIPARDAVDARLVAEYRTGTGTFGGDNNYPVLAAGAPQVDTDHDGMPNAFESARGLDPGNAADGATDRDADGYTNLEEYLAVAALAPPGAKDLIGKSSVEPIDTPANRKPRLRCTRSVCRIPLRCYLTQGSGTPCNSAVHVFVRADASRLAGDRAAPKRVKFASGVAHLEPGQIANVRIRLTKRGRRIVRTTTRTTLRGRLQIQNPGGAHETQIRITLRR